MTSRRGVSPKQFQTPFGDSPLYLRNKSLIEKLSFYGSYHGNLVNILIHIVFVPLIEFCTMGLLLYLSLTKLNSNIITEPFAGFIRAAWLLMEYLILFYIYITPAIASGSVDILWIFLYIKIFSWVMQIGGHQIFEGRSPAFLDNVNQALVLAPFFVLLEVMFFSGYRADLYKEVEKATKKQRDEFENNNMKHK